LLFAPPRIGVAARGCLAVQTAQPRLVFAVELLPRG
jgi:hypothetical protein